MDTPPPIPLHAIVKACEEQVSCDLEGEVLILHLPRGMYYGLDAIGAYIWQMLQQPRTVQEMHETLVQEYDVTAERCEADLQALLQQFVVHGLIEIHT